MTDAIAGAFGAALGATLIAATGVAAVQAMSSAVQQTNRPRDKKHSRKEGVEKMIWG